MMALSHRKVSFVDLLEPPAMVGVVGSSRCSMEAVIMASMGWTDGLMANAHQNEMAARAARARMALT